MKQLCRYLMSFFLVTAQSTWSIPLVISQVAISIPAEAQVVNPMEAPITITASEYYVGRDYGKPLVSIHLISGVTKPGVYHVPMGTNLAQLIAYAGGAHEKADLEEVSIRRTTKEGNSVLLVDLKKYLESTSEIPQVHSADVIHIPMKASVEKTLTWVSLISGIVSIGLSVAIIQDVNRRKSD